jgi:hypothetical protein
MRPLLSARTSLVAEVATVRGVAPAALYGRPPPGKAHPRRSVAERVPDVPTIEAPERPMPQEPRPCATISAPGPSQTAALYHGQGGVIASAITVHHQPLSLSLAATCRNLPLAIRRFIT